MKNSQSYLKCFHNLCDYIIHKQHWELLSSPSLSHQTACFKNLKTGLIYTVVQHSSKIMQESQQWVQYSNNLPDIFLKHCRINQNMSLMQKPCRSFESLNFTSALRQFNNITQDQIKNTLAPIFKAILHQKFPSNFQIRKQNIVVDYFGKIRFLHPLLASAHQNHPPLLYSLQQLVIVILFGFELEGRFLEEFSGESGFIKLIKKMIKRNFSDQFLVFVISLLHCPASFKQIQMYATFLDGQQETMEGQNMQGIRQWAKKRRYKMEQQRQAEEDKKAQKRQFCSANINNQKYQIYLGKTQIKEKVKKGPHGAKYRNGIRMEMNYSESEDDDRDYSSFSRSLTKNILTEEESAIENPQNISI